MIAKQSRNEISFLAAANSNQQIVIQQIQMSAPVRSDRNSRWVLTSARFVGVVRLAGILGVAFLVSGCASPNVNPSAPRASTGYVDFYAKWREPLAWDVRRFDAKTEAFKKVFYDLDPLEGRILRLSF